ncbi:uncharacterized protein LOC119554726 isoform X1 [Drosophila subpulchrella]|uniref:uncharacterized protein LOC119554726 isoform X1 n=1 Tax=Drosophila subpulchrella TaxID=1486046 RepID=UPI0018A12EEA|nr:uncharacterized protein LOC119554726 isoform X1 [Drosophila subpulchrella]
MNGKIQKSLADDMASSTFGAEVLIGNWAERRYAVVEQSNAILPGLRVSGCEHHRSLCQDTYTRAPFDRAETVPFFVQHRKLAYQNFVRNRRSCLNLVDHELLKRNFTTTNTLEFQELPRLRLLHANRDTEKSGPPNQPADVDRLQAFGNLTKTHNYLKRFKCAQLLEEISNMQTTYSASFNRPWMSKPIFEYGADYDGVVKFDLAC